MEPPGRKIRTTTLPGAVPVSERVWKGSFFTISAGPLLATTCDVVFPSR